MMSAHFAKNLSPFRVRAAVAASSNIGNLYIAWQNTIDLQEQKSVTFMLYVN